MTCTASASDSSRRLRSSSPVSCSAAAMRWRSHAVSAAVPMCSPTAAAWRSCATWRRSVSRRSPSAAARTRPGSPSASVSVSVSEATPLSRSRRAQACSRRCSSSHSSSPAHATRSALQPRNGVRAAERARGACVGRSTASSSRSQSWAEGEPNTLPAPLMTAGTSTASSASRICAACRWLRTSTATWPGRTGSRRRTVPSSARVSTTAAESSRRTTLAGQVVGDVPAGGA